jgi:hypothetical protein
MKMWLKVPVQEKDEQGRPRFTGGKRSKQGTPRGGVISPLLANIYINRLLKAFAKSDLMRRSGRQSSCSPRDEGSELPEMLENREIHIELGCADSIAWPFPRQMHHLAESSPRKIPTRRNGAAGSLGGRSSNDADDFVGAVPAGQGRGGVGAGQATDRWVEADAQRSQDETVRRVEGVLPLSGIRAGPADEPAEPAGVAGSPTLEEGDGRGP